MSELGPIAYVGIFAGSVTLSLLLVPVALRVAVRWNVLDHPGGYKSQRAPIPYLGGVAMLLAFTGAIGLSALVRPPVSGLTELLAILGAAAFLALVGLVDDLRGLGVTVRVTATVAAAMALWASGTHTQLFTSSWPDALITVLWVVGITNALNLLDNMDGLSAGVATIASMSFFLVAAANGQYLVAGLSIALAGCAVGFLRHNRFPARIYMGDAGSLFLGFMLAALGIRLRFEAGPPVAVVVPLLVLALPIFDTTFVTVSRTLRRANPFAGGSDHVSHRIVARGAPVPTAVRTLYGVAATLGALALLVSVAASALLTWIVVVAVLSSAVLGAAALRDGGALRQRRRDPHWPPRSRARLRPCRIARRVRAAARTRRESQTLVRGESDQ